MYGTWKGLCQTTYVRQLLPLMFGLLTSTWQRVWPCECSDAFADIATLQTGGSGGLAKS
jgi:hypothetical protein